MRSLLLAATFVVLGALLIASSISLTGRGNEELKDEITRYNNLAENYIKFYPQGEEFLEEMLPNATDLAEAYSIFREDPLVKWYEFAETAESPPILARTFFYLGAFYYVEAYDARDVEVAEFSVSALENSLRHEPGSPEQGLSDFSILQRRILEMARILRDELQKENEGVDPKPSDNQQPQQILELEPELEYDEEMLANLPVVEEGVEP